MRMQARRLYDGHSAAAAPRQAPPAPPLCHAVAGLAGHDAGSRCLPRCHPPATLSLSHSRRSSMIANGRASLLCYYLTTSATSFGYGQQGRCVHYERIFYVLLSVVSIRCCVQGCTPVWECMRASPGPWGTSLEARLAQGACLLSCYSATGTSQTQTTRPCWPWMTAS